MPSGAGTPSSSSATPAASRSSSASRPQATRLTVGRAAASDVCLDFDPEVSNLHAELERIGEHWVLVDDGLSKNGTFVTAKGSAALHQAHRQVKDAVFLSGVVDRDHVRVLDRGGEPGFAFEAPAKLRIGG
jgi:FHA domain